MKTIGLIGLGKHGIRYAHHIINDCPNLQLGGVSRRSLDGEQQARKWGVPFYSDFRKLIIDPTIEAVIGVVPPGINLEIAQLCADLNKPLLLEKPLARTGSEAMEIVTLMGESAAALTVGQTLRYNPVIKELGSRLTGMGRLHSFAVNQRLEPSDLDWHDDKEAAGGGVTMHTAVHIFDALRVITGMKVKRVIAKANYVHSKTLEDLLVVLAEFDNGAIGTIDVSRVGSGRSGRYEFICSKGQLHGDQIHGVVEVIEQQEIVHRQLLGQLPTIKPLLNDWESFLHNRAENPIPGADGWYAVMLCEACIQAATEQRWVEIDYSATAI